MLSLLKLIATAAAMALLVVPTAFGSNLARPDDRAIGPRSNPTPQVVRPDDRSGYRGVPVVVQSTPAAATHDGFDFGDAGIGAAATAGIFLILAGSVLLIVRRRARVAM